MSDRGDGVNFLMKSRLRQRKCTFKWVLEDFSKYENGKYVHSSPFYLEQDRVGFTVSVHRSGKKLYSTLRRHSSALEVVIKYKVTITDGKDKVWYTYTGTLNIGSYSATDFVNGIVCCREENDTIAETVDITVALEMDEIKTEEFYKSPTQDEFVLDVHKSFSQEIASLFENETATDVTLRVEEDSVGAHKAILSARSPVFAKMFQQDSKESHSNVVDIQDLDLATVKEFLSYIYSNARCNYDFPTALAVYYAADKYQVVKLREICASILVTHLDKDNAGCLLKLADRHRDKELKQRIMSFINFSSKSCVKSNWWKEIMSEQSDLAAELENLVGHK